MSGKWRQAKVFFQIFLRYEIFYLFFPESGTWREAKDIFHHTLGNFCSLKLQWSIPKTTVNKQGLTVPFMRDQQYLRNALLQPVEDWWKVLFLTLEGSEISQNRTVIQLIPMLPYAPGWEFTHYFMPSLQIRQDTFYDTAYKDYTIIPKDSTLKYSKNYINNIIKMPQL